MLGDYEIRYLRRGSIEHQLVILATGNHDVLPSIAVDVSRGNSVGTFASVQRKWRARHLRKSAFAITQQNGDSNIFRIRNIRRVGNDK